MKTHNRVSLFLLAAAVLAAPAPVLAADAPPQPPPAKVVVQEVKMQSVAENDSFLGLLYYDREGSVSSEVTGLVTAIEVDEGDQVAAGDVLLRLDMELLDQEVATLHTEMEQLDLRIQYTEKNFRRLETLYARDGVSEKDLDDARFAFQDAQSTRQVAQRRLETLEIRQRKSVIRAPFGGVILEKSVEAGDWVSQGRALVRIGAADKLFVRVPVAERLLRFVKMGSKVPVVVTAYDKQVKGTVVDIDPTADAKTKNVFIKVGIPPLSGAAENMSASVRVPTSAKLRELGLDSLD